MSSTFLPGLQLSRRFYADAVRPLLDEVAPGVRHSAARIGSGSEVLGFDTLRSADHEWGPRVQLFLSPADLERVGGRLDRALSERLPATFHGWSTNFGPAGAPIRVMEPAAGPIRHRVDLLTVTGFVTDRLGVDTSTGLDAASWLSAPWQRLAELTAGAVFHDGLGTLTAVRQDLSWYPDDVWRYVLACQWQRLAEEEAFPGRCEEVGDELGARVVVARLVRDMMRLVLLMDRRYPPYAKWLGSALADTDTGTELHADLVGALGAAGWPERERHLAAAYRRVARAHNELGLTDLIDASTRLYYDRPFTVLGAERFADALRATLPPDWTDRPLTGSIDQIVDSTAVLEHPDRRGIPWPSTPS